MCSSHIHEILYNAGTTSTSTTTTTSPAFTVTSDVTTAGAEFETESDVRGAIAGGILSGTFLMLLLVTPCLLVPVLVRRVKKRRDTASLNSSDVYTLLAIRSPDHELQENAAYDSTNIPTATNAAYLSTGKDVTNTLNDEYTYEVPGGISDHNDESPDYHELKRNEAYTPTDIPTVKNAAYLSTRKNEINPEEYYDYVVN